VQQTFFSGYSIMKIILESKRKDACVCVCVCDGIAYVKGYNCRYHKCTLGPRVR